MRHSKMAYSQQRIYTRTKQSNTQFQTTTLFGVGIGVIIALGLFWIPIAIIYALSGWLYVIAYGLALVGATALAGVFSRNKFRSAPDI